MSEHETPATEPWHRQVLEHRAGLFAVLTTVAISIGGLAEIVPMYTVPSNLPHVDGVKPYTPLELAGRDIYLREGCYNCHSQMVRPLRAETQRYGEWTRASELQYDRPFQLGSRRIGPDLQRVGGGQIAAAPARGASRCQRAVARPSDAGPGANRPRVLVIAGRRRLLRCH